MLLGILGAMTLPDFNWRPPPPPYTRETVKPTHLETILPILELWNESLEGHVFCSKVRSLPGCWDVSNTYIPGKVINGIVRTKTGETLMVVILPSVRWLDFGKQNSTNPELLRRLPAILYHLPKSSGAFIVTPSGQARSVNKRFGFELQERSLERLISN